MSCKLTRCLVSLGFLLQMACQRCHTCERKEPDNIGGVKLFSSGSSARAPPIRLQNQSTWMHDRWFPKGLSFSNFSSHLTGLDLQLFSVFGIPQNVRAVSTICRFFLDAIIFLFFPQHVSYSSRKLSIDPRYIRTLSRWWVLRTLVRIVDGF